MTTLVLIIIAVIILNIILINNLDNKIKLSNKLYKSIQYNKNKKK
jgi:hypothetical protein